LVYFTIAQADELEQIRVTLDEVAPPHAAAAIAGADDGVAAFGARLREGIGRKERGADGGGAGHLDELASGAVRLAGHGADPSTGATAKCPRIL
jgi:hypothetical protein